MVFAITQTPPVQQVDNQRAVKLSKTTLANESSDHLGAATALAVELAS